MSLKHLNLFPELTFFFRWEAKAGECEDTPQSSWRDGLLGPVSSYRTVPAMGKFCPPGLCKGRFSPTCLNSCGFPFFSGESVERFACNPQPNCGHAQGLLQSKKCVSDPWWYPSCSRNDEHGNSRRVITSSEAGSVPTSVSPLLVTLECQAVSPQGSHKNGQALHICYRDCCLLGKMPAGLGKTSA